MYLYKYKYKYCEYIKYLETCLICLEEGTNVNAITHCGLYYVHTKCYSQWLLKIILVLFVENL